MATYRQVEGTATISTVLAIQATEYALLESNPKELGTNSNGDDVWGLGSKITVTGGGLNMRGREVGYYQEEGEATFEKGVVLNATTNASFETDSDWVTDSPGTKITVPAGGITVQGGSADLRFTDGTVDVNGNVVVKGAEGAVIWHRLVQRGQRDSHDRPRFLECRWRNLGRDVQRLW